MTLRPPDDHHRRLPRQSTMVVVGVFLVSVLALLALSTGQAQVAHAQPPPPSSQPTVPPFSPRPTSPQPPPSFPATTSAVPPIVVAPTTAQPSTTAPSEPVGPGQIPTSQPEDPAWYDIPGQITKAINGWFRDLVTAALRPVLDLVGRTVLATPNVTTDPRVREIWGTVALIANTIFVLLVTAGGVLVMSHETLQTRHTLRDILPRIVVAFIAANLSLALVSEAITVANALARALLGMDTTPDRVSALLITMLVDPLGASIFLLLIGLVAAVLALVLLATYVVRLALTVLLVVAAPLALALHALPQTDGLARLWWRAIIGCFIIQLAQALTLIVAVRVFFGASGQANPRDWTGGSNPLVDLLVACVLMYVLIRIPTWVFRQVFGGQRSVLVSIAKYALIGKAIGALRGGQPRPVPGAVPSRGTRPPGPGGGAPGGARPRGPRPVPSGPTHTRTVGRAQRATALSTRPRTNGNDQRARPHGDAVVLRFPAPQPRSAASADPRLPTQSQPGAARASRPSPAGPRHTDDQAPSEARAVPRATTAASAPSTPRHRRLPAGASPPVPAPQPRAPRRGRAAPPPPPSALPPRGK